MFASWWFSSLYRCISACIVNDCACIVNKRSRACIGNVSWIIVHVSWIIVPVSWNIVPVSWITVPVSWIIVPVSWIIVHVSWIIVHVSWIIVHVSWITAHPWALSRFYCKWSWTKLWIIVFVLRCLCLHLEWSCLYCECSGLCHKWLSLYNGLIIIVFWMIARISDTITAVSWIIMPSLWKLMVFWIIDRYRACIVSDLPVSRFFIEWLCIRIVWLLFKLCMIDSHPP